MDSWRWLGLNRKTGRISERITFEQPHAEAKRESTSGRIMDPTGPSPDPELTISGQHRGYWVLSEDERAKGFIRPVRLTYTHMTCSTDTTMSRDIAETYARRPGFYGRTWCCACGDHLPVGPGGQFVWKGSNEKVGT